ACEEGYKEIGGECKKCHDSCKSCTAGIAANQCASCNTFFRKAVGTTCICDPLKSFEDVRTKKCMTFNKDDCKEHEWLDEHGECRKCDMSCGSCVYEDEEYCTTCKKVPETMQGP
ncbi:MAG: hypothetical protein V2I33_17430, partial [Kangiellaceae bacterium]|nr:hypothetical protein [Kangiellaceae bacterium]